MRDASGLDVRLPIGVLFTALGLILAGYGLSSAGVAGATGRVALPLNLNFWWGLAMFVFGALMLTAGMLAARRAAARLATESPEGRATEAREHDLGLER
jgi:membrane protein implicated in regulation of membrane protease activity